MRYVILGSGIAGITACETLRSLDKDSTITLISDELNPLYSKPMLSKLLSPDIDSARLILKPEGFFEELKINRLFGLRAEEINPEERFLVLSSGETLPFDRLLIATGASAYFPPIEGLNKKSVFGLRTWKDAIMIKEALKDAKKVLVVGGGLIGLEIAHSLIQLGLKVKVVEIGQHLAPQILDEGSSLIIEERLSEKGISFILGRTVKALEGSIVSNRVKYAILDDGSIVETDLVIIAAGVKPNTEIAERAGIEVKKGIVVDEYLKTNVEGIYAAGDVAESKDMLTGTHILSPFWITAVRQGKFAALNMAGKVSQYPGSLVFQGTMSFGEIPVTFCGTIPKDSTAFEEITLSKPKEGIYKKLWIKDESLWGMIFVGDVKNAGLIACLIQNRFRVSGIKDRLLDPSFSYAYFIRKGIAKLNIYN